MTDLPADHVRTLLAVVDHGTFDAAASALHVTPSAVSQRIKALEQRTGRVLLMRTKPVRLTDSGQVVVRFARQLAQLERDARTELGMTTAGEPTRLSIAVNADSLATWFLPALAQVPGVCFELHREDEGHTTQLLREGVVMAAVTSTPDPVQGCSVRPLGSLRYLACASPALPFTGFAETPVIVFDRFDHLQDRFAATFPVLSATGLPDRAGDLPDRSTAGLPDRAAGDLPGHSASGSSHRAAAGASPFRHQMPSSTAYLDAVLAGMGWGLIPVTLALPHLATRALVNLTPSRHMDVPLFWQQWKLDSLALAAAADAIVQAAAATLIQG